MENIHHVPIEEIKIGERRREALGDVDGLAGSIERYSLLHPIITDLEWNLIAGERRLRACEKLGWRVIPVRIFEDLTEDEKREIEVEENIRRKDLTAYEQSREVVRKAPLVAEDLARKIPTKVPRGSPRQMAVPKEDVAQALGVDRKALLNAEQHVETADEFPFMQRTDWAQDHVLRARKLLKQLGSTERESVLSLIQPAGVPAPKAVKALENFSKISPAARTRLVDMIQSPDDRLRTLAVTTLIDAPPMPDIRSVELALLLDKAKWCASRYEDRAKPLIQRVIDAIKDAMAVVEEIEGERIDATAVVV